MQLLNWQQRWKGYTEGDRPRLSTFEEIARRRNSHDDESITQSRWDQPEESKVGESVKQVAGRFIPSPSSVLAPNAQVFRVINKYTAVEKSEGLKHITRMAIEVLRRYSVEEYKNEFPYMLNKSTANLVGTISYNLRQISSMEKKNFKKTDLWRALQQKKAEYNAQNKSRRFTWMPEHIRR